MLLRAYRKVSFNFRWLVSLGTLFFASTPFDSMALFVEIIVKL